MAAHPYKFLLRPAEPADVDCLAAQEAGAYSDDDAIPRDRLHEWFAANPHIFSVLCAHDGTPVGHLNLLPLKPEPLQALMAGHIRERDLPASGLHSAGERPLVTTLWIESLLVELPSPMRRARALASLLAQMPAMFDRLSDPARLTHIYALAATNAGDDLVHHLGFQVVSHSTQRADAHNLYGITPEEFLKNIAGYQAR